MNKILFLKMKQRAIVQLENFENREAEETENMNRENEIMMIKTLMKCWMKLDCRDITSDKIGDIQGGEPTTYEEAMSSEHRTKWKEAIKNEMGALKENETWIVEENSKGVGVIDCKWVFKEKKDEVGNIIKYKARLVARGFQQTSDCILDKYTPVAKLPTIRFFLTICNVLKIPIYQLDVCSAFQWRY
ncbi:hypothetical protein JTB14_001050 [Gonioctena quinquepunctata]|nr:hypothetical protein JTB14_001050 [Gonioctena quinquepunctata]